MPRALRVDLPAIAHHVWVRGNNRHAIFFSEADRLLFLKYLGEARARRQCDIHAFVLMTNHVHLLATPRVERGLSKMMQDVGRKYVRYINRSRERTGGLYEGRFKSSLVQTESYFLNCMRYIERNPVRAGMVAHPAQYAWSSFGQNVTGEPTGLVTPHPEYLALGADAESRGNAYYRLFGEELREEQLEEIRRSIQQGSALGGEDFCRAVESLVGHAVSYVPQGRPESRA
jgi:putative transposase